MLKALLEEGMNAVGVDVTDTAPQLPEGTGLAFNVIHGTFGEDGGLQDFLEGLGVAYTGAGAEDGVCNVAGQVGSLRYAIQGNVIAGEAVCLEAEQALITTQGDLATRVMAAMEAARAMGGDGRCSCSFADPDGCGTPPPGTWKSAHTAFIALARIGDPLVGPCPLDLQPGVDQRIGRVRPGATDPQPRLRSSEWAAFWS